MVKLKATKISRFPPAMSTRLLKSWRKNVTHDTRMMMPSGRKSRSQ